MWPAVRLSFHQQNTMKIHRILFIHNALTSFVQIDRDILAQKYEVEEFGFRSKFKLRPIQLWKAVKRNDMLFIWFASWHSLLPVIFAALQKKLTVLVAGGYDTANIPEAKYGNQRNWFKRLVTRYILQKVSHIICNSQFSMKETLRVADISPDKVSMIYHGIPDSGIRPAGKFDIALNVGNVLEENLLRKGISLFLEAGQLLPAYRFVQAGRWQDNSHEKLRKCIASNVELKGFVEKEELNTLFGQSRVYVQPSLHEGFGLSVIEAMQAGCIPIVSSRGALPEIVGKYGIILEDLTPHAIAKSISLLDKYRFTPMEIRDFVLDNYNLDLRSRALLKCIDERNCQDVKF